MAVSSEKFELTQDELDSLLGRLQTTLASLARRKTSGSSASATPLSSAATPLSPPSEECKHYGRRARSQLAEARGLVDDMEQEARMAPAQYRVDMLSSVRDYRQQLGRLQSELNKHSNPGGGGRRALLGLGSTEDDDLGGGSGGGARPPTTDEMYRRQLLDGASVLEQTSQSILRSQQVALESEEIGEEIVSDLGLQRETLERAHSRLQETNAEISRSRKVLRRIYFGVVQNKLVLMGIIVLEVLLLAALIYWKYFA